MGDPQRETSAKERSLRVAHGELYLKLRDAIEANPPPTEQRMQVLLSAESRAWIRAYGSRELRAMFDAERTTQSLWLTPAQRRSMGMHPFESSHVRVLNEWVVRERDMFPASRGELCAFRMPGEPKPVKFVMMDDPTQPGRVKPVLLSEAPLEFRVLVVGIERPNNAWDQPLRTHAFLGLRGDLADFVVVDPKAPSKNPWVHSVHWTYGARAGDEHRSAALAKLAMPAQVAARERLRIALKAQYGRALREVPETGARGRLDRVIVDKAQVRAVVVANDAVHVVRLGVGPQARDQAQCMIGKPVELSRTAQGVQMSLSRGLDRAVGKTWRWARDEGLGR